MYHLVKEIHMPKKILSIFIDESGDFGVYNFRSPLYLVTMVFHDQQNSITKSIQGLETHLQSLGYPQHAIHTGPLIRRESIYLHDIWKTENVFFMHFFTFPEN